MNIYYRGRQQHIGFCFTWYSISFFLISTNTNVFQLHQSCSEKENESTTVVEGGVV